MRALLSGLMVLVSLSFNHCRTVPNAAPPAENRFAHGASTAVQTGTIDSDMLVECSGLDVSMVHDDLLWAINDSGDGPYLYALGKGGRDRGRIEVMGAVNRDWEDLATFKWQDKAMILIADVGDNRQHHGTYRLYIIEEPRLAGERFDRSTVVHPAWTITFRYPDHGHDAEAVSVDLADGQILVLTKRDVPPILYRLPLTPENPDAPIVAQRLTDLDQIPAPTADDLSHPYGKFRSQPTAMDLTMDGLTMLVLTYKHAYVFHRNAGDKWGANAKAWPITITLPLPQDSPDFGQREAACFSVDERQVHVTSEGQHAGLYLVGF